MSFDLFSSVDYAFSKFSSFSNISFFFSLILIFKVIYKSGPFSRFHSFMSFIYSSLSTNLKMKMFRNKGVFLFMMSLFVLILYSKLNGLAPFVFGWTPHVLMILSFSFFIWLLIQVQSLTNNPMTYVSHFTPSGVPLGLGLFLSKIELMSNIIRPLTLSLRLGINMTTGHVLLALLSVMMISKFNFVMLILLSFYFLFELFVMMMQAVVFSLLISQYIEGKKT